MVARTFSAENIFHARSTGLTFLSGTERREMSCHSKCDFFGPTGHHHSLFCHDLNDLGVLPPEDPQSFGRNDDGFACTDVLDTFFPGLSHEIDRLRSGSHLDPVNLEIVSNKRDRLGIEDPARP